MMIEYLRVLFTPYTGYRRVEPIDPSVGLTKEKWDREFFIRDAKLEKFSPEISGSKGAVSGVHGKGLSIWV